MPPQFFESILANLQSGIIVVDPDYRIEMVNNYVAEFCGMPLAHFPGKNLGAVIPEFLEKIQGGATAGEFLANFSDGEKGIGFNRADLIDAQGDRAGFIIHFKDLTEIMRIRQDLREKERLAAIGEVVGKFAHEMRNPLFAVTAAAQILEMELSLAPQQQELMNSLLRESRRLNNLVEVLQECTRDLRINRKPVDLSRVLREVVHSVAALIQERQVVVRPYAGPEIWLCGDSEKLKRALLSLVTNAAEASAPGGEVTLAIKADGDEVVVTVSDQGEGIPPDNLNKVFELFYTTRKNRSGLGLASCRSIVAAHGGTLTAESGADGGANFVVQLPRGEVS